MKNETIALTMAILGGLTIDIGAASPEMPRTPTTLRVPDGPGMTVMASQAPARPGTLVAADVYLSNIDDLGAYQVRLKASGGRLGSLTIEDVQIDRTRADYVFGDDQILDVVDSKAPSAQAGAVSVEGGTAVGTNPMYAATFYFRASQDAKGTFTINLEKGPAASMMTTSKAVVVPFKVGQPVAITITTPKRTVTRTE
ncbi:MAG: hypothetical protein ACYTFA_10010 [Planctomycetota bacterium]|jgi:hypothetical protein